MNPLPNPRRSGMFSRCNALARGADIPRPQPQSGGSVFDITKAGISRAAPHTHRFEATLDVYETPGRRNARYGFG